MINDKKSTYFGECFSYVHLQENFHRFFLNAASLAGLSSPEKGLDKKIFFLISFPWW